MANLLKLNESELNGKLRQLTYIQMGISSIGTIAGWVYANKTGGGFWRYVGFGFMGGVITGSIGYFTTVQMANKIKTELDVRSQIKK